MNDTNRHDTFYTGTLAIKRHNHLSMGKPGMYRVVARNIELAHMQGVKPGDANFNAVVDDFGNLVRVQ